MLRPSRVDQPLAADGHGRHLAAAGVQALAHQVVAGVLAGAGEEPAAERELADDAAACPAAVGAGAAADERDDLDGVAVGQVRASCSSRRTTASFTSTASRFGSRPRCGSRSATVSGSGKDCGSAFMVIVGMAGLAGVCGQDTDSPGPGDGSPAAARAISRPLPRSTRWLPPNIGPAAADDPIDDGAGEVLGPTQMTVKAAQPALLVFYRGPFVVHQVNC